MSVDVIAIAAAAMCDAAGPESGLDADFFRQDAEAAIAAVRSHIEREAKRAVLERIEDYAVEHAYRDSDDTGVVAFDGLTDLVEAELAALEGDR